jgi:hypothetical protein
LLPSKVVGKKIQLFKLKVMSEKKMPNDPNSRLQKGGEGRR